MTVLLLASVGMVTFSGCALFGGSKKLDRDTVFWNQSMMSDVKRVTDEPRTRKAWPVISPDGTKLLYCETEAKVSRSALYGYYEWNIAYLRNVNSPVKTDLVQTLNTRAPTWTENNDRFYYIRWEDANARIIRSSVVGGGATYATRNPIGFDNDRPNVKRGRILSDTMQSGRRILISCKEDGSDQTQLGEGEQPSFHPTQNKIVYIRIVSGLRCVYEMDLDNPTQVHEIYRDRNDYNCRAPSYSACGRFILFQKGAESKATGMTSRGVNVSYKAANKWQIFIMRADGQGGLTPLTSGNTDVYFPTMDANGNVYFVAEIDSIEVWRGRVNTASMLLD